MDKEQLINFPLGVLSSTNGYLSCYSPREGVLIVNDICIVSPSINKINCNFTGCLNNQNYSVVIFTSKVSLKLSSVINQNIKAVYFLDGNDEIDFDIDIQKDKLPLIAIPNNHKSTTYKFCKAKRIKYDTIFNHHHI